MRIKNTKLVKRFENFVKGLKKSDKVSILHHTDPDGVSSAVVMNKLVSLMRKKQIELKLNQKPNEISVTQETFNTIKDSKVSKLIITDLCVDQSSSKTIKAIEKFADILIIDHHKLYHDLNSSKTIFIKPQLVFDKVDPSKYCASKLAFDLGSRVADLSEYNWVAAIGIIGDNVHHSWKSFMKGVFREHKIKNMRDIRKTELGKVAETLFFTEAYDYKKVKDCFEVLNSASSYNNVLSSRLVSYRRKIEGEIEYWKGNVRKLAEFYPMEGLVFDYIKPQFSIRSAISSEISGLYPNSTVIIAEDMRKGIIQLSARRKDRKIAVNDLIEKSIRRFSGASGGGHTNAAGGTIKTKDLDRFKMNVLSLLRNP